MKMKMLLRSIIQCCVLFLLSRPAGCQNTGEYGKVIFILWINWQRWG